MAPVSRSSSSHDGLSLSLGQTMMLHGVIPVLLAGLLLPVGLVAAFLALEDGSIKDAVEHGELFLAAGNSGFVGCLALVSSRTDKALNALIASFVVLLTIVMPAYGCWSLLTAQALLSENYSHDLATIGGGCYAAISIIVALVFVRLSYRPPVQ